VSLRARAAGEAIDGSCHDVLGDRMLRLVIAVGARGAGPAAVTQAIVQGWQWLAVSSIPERRALHAQLRVAIARGHTNARAWLPLALSEIDPVLLRAAVIGYLGSAPRSVEQRGQVIDDVIEWFRRGLTLDRVAVFVSLLALREPDVNERLASLRGRLTDAERDRVLCECAGATDTLTREFIADWCGEPVTAPAQPD
jgi:hypothetical protein